MHTHTHTHAHTQHTQLSTCPVAAPDKTGLRQRHTHKCTQTHIHTHTHRSPCPVAAPPRSRLLCPGGLSSKAPPSRLWTSMTQSLSRCVWGGYKISRVGQNVYIHRIRPYIWLIPCKKYRICTVYIWFWPTLVMRQPSVILTSKSDLTPSSSHPVPFNS